MAQRRINKDEFDEEYLPQSQNRQRGNGKKRQSNKSSTTNTSKWTLQENKKFSNFIKCNREILLCPIKRKEQRVFLKMSQQIKTRSPDQCRSHHQKMIKYHASLEGIIDNIEKRCTEYNGQSFIGQNISTQESIFEKNCEIELVDIFQNNLEGEYQIEKNDEESIWNVLSRDSWTDVPLLFYD